MRLGMPTINYIALSVFLVMALQENLSIYLPENEYLGFKINLLAKLVVS